MKSILLTIEYKTGAKIKEVVNYVHFEDGKICYSLKKGFYGHMSLYGQVNIPLEVIKCFDITETEQEYHDRPLEVNA